MAPLPARIKAVDRLGWALAVFSTVVGLGFIALPFHLHLGDHYGNLRLDGLSTASQIAANPWGNLGFGVALLLAVLGFVVASAAPRHKRFALGAIASTALGATAVGWIGIGAPLRRWDHHVRAIDDAIAEAPADDRFSGRWGGAHAALWISPTGLAAKEHGGCFGTTGRRIGTAAFEDKRVVLQWKRESETLFPVQWGSRRYLVSDESPLLFCASVRGTSHERGVYRGYGNGPARRTGLPNAPADDLRCLGPGTVKASLTARTRDWAPNGDVVSAEFELDAGWDDLVFLGRQFDIHSSDGNRKVRRAVSAYPVDHQRSRIHVSLSPGEERPDVGWVAESAVEDELAEVRSEPEGVADGGE